ncbi:DUF6471 domain-containing protein [Hyphomonas beringensis]
MKRWGAIGVEDNEANIRNKHSRGKFIAAFMSLCLKAIGSQRLYVI